MPTTQPSPCPAGSIDDYAPTFDVTDTLVVKVDAEPEALGAALEHVGLTTSAVVALSVLGPVDRVALAPALLAAEAGPELVFGLVWRHEGPTETVDPARVQTFDTPGHVKVIWDLSVQPDALEGAWLSMTRRFAATDEVTRARLLDGWGIIGPVADSLARRIVAAVKAYAEDWHEPPARGQWTLRRIDAAPLTVSGPLGIVVRAWEPGGVGMAVCPLSLNDLGGVAAGVVGCPGPLLGTCSSVRARS